MFDARFLAVMARVSSPFPGEQEAAYNKAIEYMQSKGYTFDTIKVWITKDNRPYFKIFLSRAGQWSEDQQDKTQEQARSEYQRHQSKARRPYRTTDWYTDFSGTAHSNPFTKESYKGKNNVILDNHARDFGFTSTNWATEAQWEKHGRKVSGNGCIIEKWGPVTDRKTGRERVVRYGSWEVFNQDQTV